MLSSIAAASQGVAISRLIGPAPSRHHSPPKHTAKITINTAITTARRLTQRSPASHRRNAPRRSPTRWKPEFERDNRRRAAPGPGVPRRPIGAPPRDGRQPGGSRSSSATTAGARDGPPPRHGPDPNRRLPTARAGRQRADWIPGATYSLPLPLGGGVDCKIDRRQRSARPHLTSAAVPASLPILD